jgi:hypothetical protein
VTERKYAYVCSIPHCKQQGLEEDKLFLKMGRDHWLRHSLLSYMRGEVRSQPCFSSDQDRINAKRTYC